MNFISVTNLPPKLPVIECIVFYLLFQHLDSPGWVYGVVYTFYGMVAVGGLYKLFNGKPVDLLADKTKL